MKLSKKYFEFKKSYPMDSGLTTYFAWIERELIAGKFDPIGDTSLFWYTHRMLYGDYFDRKLASWISGDEIVKKEKPIGIISAFKEI